jgi:predicted DNA-binding transcriptional regulator AlpA
LVLSAVQKHRIFNDLSNSTFAPDPWAVLKLVFDSAIESNPCPHAHKSSRRYMMVRTVLRRKAVLDATGWSVPTLYRKMADGKFPKATKLDPDARAVVWFADEVEAWQKRPAGLVAA